MARIVLETSFPFASYGENGLHRYTIDEENNYIRIEYETAKTKAGMYPFKVVSSHLGEKDCVSLSSALLQKEKCMKVQSAAFNGGYEHGESIKD